MKNLKKRKSIRLSTYDYHRNGSYFITICIQNRENRLGQIKNQTILLNNAGLMVQQWIINLSEHFPNITIQHKIIMPNHLHFILDITYSDQHTASISQMMQWFKTMTTNQYIRGVKDNIYPSFYKRLWQRNYYEHIIRNENSFSQIAQYIQNNPKSWKEDILFNP